MLKLRLLDLLITILACYRLAQFVSLDEGPARVFERLRNWSLSQQAKPGGQSLVAFLECPYCQGVWLAGILALTVAPRNILDWFVMTLAIAGGQAFLQAMGDRQRNDDNGPNDGRHI